ncbi:MAG: glycosyltransferase family 2 protein [Nanoarchaeota archaeon]|nr:glycosyltransferase family 2 protein [Nanoarchaeota archaeon]
MWQGNKISIVLPAYNEGGNIRKAIDDFYSTKVVDEIIVVDNNSRDNTAEEVRKTKARLVQERMQGYGFALRRGLKEAKGNFIVMCEPDGTFMAKDLFKLLTYTDDFDAVFGTRTSKECIWTGANMNLFLRLGNEFVAKLLEYFHNGPQLTDVGCTFKLIKRDALGRIQHKFTVGKSHFSPEFMILCIKNRIKTVEIPLNYRPRIGTSKITGKFWKAFKLGLVMIWLIIAYKFK